MSRHIEVWHDKTSDSDSPVWCVSLCEDDGDEVKCLSTHETEYEAEAVGEVEAAHRHIDACKRDTDGSVWTYAQFTD